MILNAMQLGFLRAIGYTLLTALLVYLSNAANLHGVVADGTALIIAGLAGALEHYLESETGNAGFGFIRKV